VIIWLITLIAILVVWIISTALSPIASSNIFEGKPANLILSNKKLITDSNGRVNILVVGMSDDDIKNDHPMYADSIALLSVDPNNYDVKYIDIPRDIIVPDEENCKYEAASVGVHLKEMYICGYDFNQNNSIQNDFHQNTPVQNTNTQNTNEQNTTAQNLTPFDSGANTIMYHVSEITGLDTNYFVKINYGALRSLIDLVGGIDIEPYTDDPRGIYDEAVGLNLAPGYQHLDGETCMNLVRARNSKEGSYGLSDETTFDRAKNQKIVINALLLKLKQNNILKKPQKLIELLSNHIQTNFDYKNVKQLIKLAKNTNSLEQILLYKDDLNLFEISTTEYGTHIVHPVLGDGNFEDIREYINNQLS
jgi:LCP family protein required for cell wall assembly